ncbi:hypothetical protein [Anaerophaga thermohalophila]|nr:hypothetical protein [Anaerophaga thermohalophila]
MELWEGLQEQVALEASLLLKKTKAKNKLHNGYIIDGIGPSQKG